MNVDFHFHSVYSDGALTPAELLDRARTANLTCLALTDHDTVEGVVAMRRLLTDDSISLIDGVELSVRWKLHELHVLGLNIDPSSSTLLTLLQQQNECRIQRAHEMARLLESIGVEQAYQKACALAGHERIGRPQLAQVLVNEGIVRDMQTAFKRYLARGRMAYVPTAWVPMQAALETIVGAGGSAVLAHPLKYKLTRSKLHDLISEFKTEGGVGIEVVSGEVNQSDIRDMAALAKRFDLLASTGSDYHSDQYSRVKLGQQRPLPLECQPIWSRWI